MNAIIEQLSESEAIYNIDDAFERISLLTDALEVAVNALERMRNENSDLYGIAKYALQQIQAIAEGKSNG